MLRLLIVVLLFCVSVPIWAQTPAFFVVVGQDTAWSEAEHRVVRDTTTVIVNGIPAHYDHDSFPKSYLDSLIARGAELKISENRLQRDTITVQPTQGDTLTIEFHAYNWPTVNGYYMDYFHGGEIRTPGFPNRPTHKMTAIDYVLSDYLTQSGLPTTQDGLVYVDFNNLQVGSVSLGDQSGSGSGLLGTLSIVVDSFFTQNIGMNSKTAYIQTQGQNAVVVDSIIADIRILIPGTTPKPEEITSDFNKNGTVDFADFLTFAQNFGRDSSSDPNFDDRVDLSENGRIDFDDFLLFASHFGKAPVVLRLRSIRG